MTQFAIPYGLWTTPRHYLPIWLMPLSNAPQCPGFQESEQETDPATSDFRNPTLTAHMMVLDFRNRNWKRTLRERIAGIGIGNGCGAVCNMAEQAFFT